MVTGDIAEPGTAARLVAAVEDAGLRLAGVLHSATVLADEIVLNMSESAAAQVFAPKVAGSWWLHQATADLDLDWWLTFSSAASLLGSPGQGAYAAANSWVDGLVAYRRSRGLPAIGINWGPWAEVGRAQFFADLGFSMITAEQGLAAMQLVLGRRPVPAPACSVSMRGSGSNPSRRRRRRRCSPSWPSRRRPNGAAAAGSAPNSTRSTPAERPARLASAIADEIQAVLRSTEPIDHDQPMESLGLDSLMALELRNRLEASLGITLPAALVWAYPTISALAGALCERMGYEPCAERPATRGARCRTGAVRQRRWTCWPISSRPVNWKSSDGSGRIMTSLADRAAQLSPQAREALARELIRAGTVFPPTPWRSRWRWWGSAAVSRVVWSGRRAFGGCWSTAGTRSARCRRIGGMPTRSMIPTRWRRAG